MTVIEKAADLAGRTLIAGMFVLAGVAKIGTFAGTQTYMASAGVPGALLPAVIVGTIVLALFTPLISIITGLQQQT